jgi:uncharacterized protein (DUF58 family)
MSRFLDPAVLSTLSSLELVARTVVDGFIAGLHRSVSFGFSQEFAEYRAYNEGDELKNIDWNVFARSERLVVKRYQGETNSGVTLLMDASNSMSFKSHAVSKMDYARYLAASLGYLCLRRQRDAAGLLVFDEEVRHYMVPSMRQGQLSRLLAGLELAEPRARTRFEGPLAHVDALLRRRGIVVLISDFYDEPQRIIRALEPLAQRGNEVLLLHVLDPEEMQPLPRGGALLVDLETGERLEVSGEYARDEYGARLQKHLKELAQGAQGAGMHHQLLVTDRPLDAALSEYLTVRGGRGG